MSMQMHERADTARGSRLLGREWELETFSVYLSHYLKMERIISIYGAAGVGKSALAEEFQNRPSGKAPLPLPWMPPVLRQSPLISAGKY